MSMYNYVLRRVGFMTVTLVLVTLIAFAVTNILPGDVALLILGPNATQESLTALQSQLGLDRPLYVQYLDWVLGLLQGNMGESLRFGEPVAALIAERLPDRYCWPSARPSSRSHSRSRSASTPPSTRTKRPT